MLEIFGLTKMLGPKKIEKRGSVGGRGEGVGLFQVVDKKKKKFCFNTAIFLRFISYNLNKKCYCKSGTANLATSSVCRWYNMVFLIEGLSKQESAETIAKHFSAVSN